MDRVPLLFGAFSQRVRGKSLTDYEIVSRALPRPAPRAATAREFHNHNGLVKAARDDESEVLPGGWELHMSSVPTSGSPPWIPAFAGKTRGLPGWFSRQSRRPTATGAPGYEYGVCRLAVTARGLGRSVERW